MAAKRKYDLPEPTNSATCRSCGTLCKLEDFRLFRPGAEPLLMDFCVSCEHVHGTLTLYRRYTAYGTAEIAKAVFQANQVPEPRRTPEQTRLLIVAEQAAEPKNNEELIRRELERREMARRHLIYYIKQTMPGFVPGWWLQDLCRRLEKFMRDVEESRSPRLIVAVPPRHGKSNAASIKFPEWVLGHHPDWPIILASYAQDLPNRFSRSVRDMVNSAEYQAIFPDTKLRHDAKGVEEWLTSSDGGLKAIGVGGGLTGFGGRCMVAGTMVTTYNGAVPIEALLHAPAQHTVLACDAEGRLHWRPVRAAKVSYRSDIVEVRTAAGRRFRCTSDHPVFVEGRGYTAAALLAPGDRLRTDGVPAVRSENVQDVDNMPPVLRVAEGRIEGHAGLRALQYRLLGAARRVCEAGAAWLTSSVLFSQLRDVCSAVRHPEVLCAVRGFDARCSRAAILHREMQAGRACGTDHSASSALRALYGSVQSETSKACVLRAQVRGRGAQATDDRHRELELPAWGELPEGVQGSEAVHPGTGREVLRGVREEDHTADTPCGRGHKAQCPEEPDHDVRHLSPEAPQIGSDTVSMVAEVGGTPVAVYDIDVEEDHCFFAEGVLVHNCLIADDLIKDAEAASSETILQNTWDWYQMVFRSRLAPGGGILLIGTRWHWNDPTGRAIELDAQLTKMGVPEYERENWDIVSYPALAENDEYLMRDGTIMQGKLAEDEPEVLRKLRNKGDALQPERYSVNELQKIRNTMTTTNWSALYQQQPTPEEGDYFTRSDFRYRWLDPAYRPLCRLFMTVDYAIGKKQRNDFTVMGVHALDSNDDLYTLEIRRGRWGTYEIAENIVQLVEKHKPELYAGEQGQIHAAVWPVVQKELDKKRLYLSIDETLVPIQDKETRARPLQGRVQRHKWFLSHDEGTRPEIYDITEREMLQFPNGVNDDIVDMAAWAARLALNLSLPTSKAPPKRQGWQDKLNTMVRGKTSHGSMAA